MSRDILIRTDGSVFTYTAVTAAKTNMVRGILEDDGSVTAPPMEHQDAVRTQIAKDMGISEKRVHVASLRSASAIPSTVVADAPEAVNPAEAPSSAKVPNPLDAVDDVLPSPNGFGDAPSAASTAKEAQAEAPVLALHDTLESMTKANLEQYAKDKFGVELDQRRRKEDLVEQIEALAKAGTA